jgi:hypothetical protein
VLAVDDFRDILARAERGGGPSTDEERRRTRDALAFLVHLVGDLHQPLHCADDGDGGGNDVAVTWRGAPAATFSPSWTLHTLWDDALVDRAMAAAGRRTPAAYAGWLVERSSAPERAAALRAPADDRDTPAAWAEESHALARSVAYAFARRGSTDSRRPVTLDERYLAAATPVVERQLRLAGVRLARVLNEIFDPGVRR